MLLREAVTNRSRWLVVLLASLLVGGLPATAADQLQVRLDGLVLPLDLEQLDAWSRDPRNNRTDLAVWFELLDDRSRQDLSTLLQAPLLRDRGLALQLLKSWAGRQVLDEVGELLSTGQSGSGVVLLATLRELLQRPEPVSFLDLLRAVPSPHLTLDLDGLLKLAQLWRRQLEDQGQALRQLRQLPLPSIDRSDLSSRLAALAPAPRPLSLTLVVAHRREPLTLQLWPATSPRHRPWVLLMPGLGGSGAQLSWLGQGLAARGWPVLLLEHPGSDEKAVRQLLDGQRPPPGAETLPDRLADVEAVLRAERTGDLPSLGDSVVLMGHSLGGLSALLASGMRPLAGLEQRCDQALDVIPLINLSRLLQCQLPEVTLPATVPPERSGELAAVVSINGFGSLLWPERGLEGLPVPLLLLGGGLDLVTPPVSEQLGLFLQHHDPRSRLVLVEGGSHFSAVRIQSQERALLQLGDGLVGVEPLKVQELMLGLTADFLASLETGSPMLAQQRLQQGVKAYVLDERTAHRWRDRLGR